MNTNRIKLEVLVQNFAIDSILADLNPDKYSTKFWMSYAELREFYTRLEV